MRRTKERGITLIALVVTIVVLLILAAITITMLLGENGIIAKAQKAKEADWIAREKEQIGVAFLTKKTEKMTDFLLKDKTVSAEELKEELEKTTGQNTVEVKGTGELKVTYKDSERTYTVNQDGNVSGPEKDEEKPDIGIPDEDDTIVVDKVTDTNPGELEGSGTQADPFVINSIEDLVAFSKDCALTTSKYKSSHVALGLSLNFKSNLSYVDPYRVDFGDVNENTQIEPLKKEVLTEKGYQSIKGFAGSFDGRNHEIANTYIYSKEGKAGEKEVNSLFITNSGTIKNLGLIKSNNVVSNDCGWYNTSALVAYNYSQGVIDNCYSKDATLARGRQYIEYTENTGGLVVTNYGMLKNSYTQGNTSQHLNEILAAGVVGTNYGTIQNCENKGSYATEQGGIVAWNYSKGKVINCINRSEVASSMAGICMRNDGIIEKCTNTGKINENASGICSKNTTAYDSSGNGSSIKECINEGEIAKGSAGIIGSNGMNSFVSGCINRGNGKDSSGGIVYKNSGKVELCKNYGEIKIENNDGNNGAGGISFINEMDGYISRCTNYGAITGSVDNYDRIGGISGSDGMSSTGEISNCRNEGTITGYYAGGIAPNSEKISSCTNTGTITGYYAGGILGQVSSGVGDLSSCTNTGMTTGYYAGGILGAVASANTTTINGSTNQGAITGYYAGGMGGAIEDGESFSVSNCVNSGNINVDGTEGSDARGGGLVGYIYYQVDKLDIENSNNVGEIKSNSQGAKMGGIIGQADGYEYVNIKNCYNQGKISGIGTVAGIAARFDSAGSAKIINCYNSGELLSDQGQVAGIGIGAYEVTSDKTKREILNCYNVGRLGSNSGYISGIGEGTIENCYNAGILVGDASDAIGSTYETHETITNNYYLDTCQTKGGDLVNIPGKIEPKTIESLKSQEFVDLLNSGITDSMWSRWKKVTDAYPNFV